MEDPFCEDLKYGTVQTSPLRALRDLTLSELCAKHNGYSTLGESIRAAEIERKVDVRKMEHEVWWESELWVIHAAGPRPSLLARRTRTWGDIPEETQSSVGSVKASRVT